MILAGDIGGTKTRIALYEVRDGRLARVVEETYKSAEHASLEEVVAKFRAVHREPCERAGFGVAGPVKDGHAKVTNLKWIVDARALEREFKIESVDVINDLVATAYGIALVAPEDCATLNRGEPDPHGNQAVLAAGTGLGQAGLFWDGRNHVPFGSEDGHSDFAPSNELQDELVRFLRPEFGHVSNERVLSGPGLFNIYRFLRDTGRGDEPAELRSEIESGDPSAAISRGALGRVPLAVDALDLFASIYGAHAGNFALSILASGGVWLGGGIAPKILPKLREPTFLRAFTDKSKLGSWLERVPVHVVLDDRAALHGAARRAWLSSRVIDANREVGGTRRR